MKTAFILLTLVLLSACANHSIDDYGANKPSFDPQTFFNNQLIAEGFVRDRSGRVTRWFTADIAANWDESGGVLDEVFLWNDGEEQTRVWNFTTLSADRFSGTAGDVRGNAKMRVAGNAIRMTYQLEVMRDNGKTIAINMDDWLYQVSEKTLINVTTMRKFGFRVGEVVLTMRVVE